MAGRPNQSNGFVFEYQGKNEQTELAFNRLISAITETSPNITGFRVELTTDEPFEVPVTVDPDQQATIGETTQKNTVDTESKPEITPTDENQGEDTESTSDDTDEIPSLRSDALPARVLSLMNEDVEEPIRTSELQTEFEEDIDTSRLSQTLASLKRRELVTAESDPDDNRANIYWTTDQAKQALSKIS